MFERIPFIHSAQASWYRHCFKFRLSNCELISADGSMSHLLILCYNYAKWLFAVHTCLCFLSLLNNVSPASDLCFLLLFPFFLSSFRTQNLTSVSLTPKAWARSAVCKKVLNGFLRVLSSCVHLQILIRRLFSSGSKWAFMVLLSTAASSLCNHPGSFFFPSLR
jgi:hypothetical protein